MSDHNIVITGFMGTGKTTVGRLVAELTGRPFVDADDEIVRRAGISIPEIFAREGEAGFRRLERQVCRFLAAQCGMVIATGGGMLVDEANRETMLKCGFLVCLNATPEAIERRLNGAKGRPLLREDWRALLEQRLPAYAAIPYQMDTTDKPPGKVAEEIIALWQRESG